MAKIAVSVDGKSINKMLKKMTGEFQHIAMENLGEAVLAGADAAEKGYAVAKYDGDVDAGVRVVQRTPDSYTLVAYGKSVKFIEYGTGVFNKKRDPGKQKYWFFSAKRPRLSATGEPTRNIYYRGIYETYEEEVGAQYYFSGGGKTNFISEDDVRTSKTGLYYEDNRGVRHAVFKIDGEMRTVRERVGVEKVDKGPRTNSVSYMTIGNPPNNVIRHAKSVIMRKFYSHYKTRYSSYDD